MSSDNNNNKPQIPTIQEQFTQVSEKFTSITSKINYETAEKLPSLKEIIGTSVSHANVLLSKLESKKHDIDTQVDAFASSRLVPIMVKAKYVFQRAVILYESREHYGPQLVAGSAFLVGSLVSLRRGRIPGFFTATATGGCAYGAIYGAPKLN